MQILLQLAPQSTHPTDLVDRILLMVLTQDLQENTTPADSLSNLHFALPWV